MKWSAQKTGTSTRRSGLELAGVTRRRVADDSHSPLAEKLVFAQEFIGASRNPAIEVSDPRPGVHNYFIGNVPAKWRTGVQGYAEVIYRDVWDGIDLRLYGNGGNLEQDFVVRPGADLGRLQVAYRGVESLRIAGDGSVVVNTALGEFREGKPRIYQQIKGKHMEVAGGFKLLSEKTIAFEVGAHDPQYALVVDPTLIFSTYLGGGGNENAQGIALDAAGDVYVTGGTTSTDFPTTTGSIQTTLAGAQDAFVTKLTPAGSQLVYSTYIGGSADDGGVGIAVDDSGSVYVAGNTLSTDFPTTLGAFQTTFGGASFGAGDAFVVKLDPTGSRIVYSTYLGGNGFDEARGLAIDGAGNAYVAGITISSNFPTTPGAFQASRRGGGEQGFVTKLNQSGSGLVYSTYLGGSVLDEAIGITVDASGSAYVTGVTRSGDFPTTPSAFQTAPGGGDDAFVTKLNPSGSAIVYSTFLGGNGLDQGIRIVVDSLPDPNAYVVGTTGSTNFPTTSGAFQTAFRGGNTDAFVAKISPFGTALIYSTYLGGNGDDDGLGIALNSSGNVYVTGDTISTNFPMVNPVQAGLAGRLDAFVTKLNASGTGLVYSTYLGGSGDDEGVAVVLDPTGNAFVVGDTSSIDFPTTPSAFRPQPPGNPDVFIAMIGSRSSASPSISTIQPNKGGDIGPVTVFISGGGFVSGTTVKLVQPGQLDIVGNPVSVSADGSSITTTFDLSGKARGLWDLIVVNPNATSVTVPGGFAIEQGLPAKVWVDIVGRSAILRSQPQTYYVLYGDRGDVDAVGVPLWIAGIPLSASFNLESPIATPPPISGAPPVNWDQVPFEVKTSNDIRIPLFISRIPPGSSGVVAVTVTTSSDVQFDLSVWLTTPFFQSPLNPDVNKCVLAETQLALSVLGFVPGATCLEEFQKFIVGKFTSATASNLSQNYSLVQMLVEVSLDGLALGAGCGVSTIPGLGQAVAGVQFSLALGDTINECLLANTKQSEQSLSVRSVSSLDPNIKLGSQGVTSAAYISGDEPLRYAIFFKNQNTATAPAQRVVVSDQLDIAVDDLSTLSLGPMAFGEKVVAPPPRSRDFATDVDLRPTQNLLVKVNGHLDAGTGLLMWRFTSVDPTTGQPPTDPLVGFLPPGAEGSVVFTVVPNQGLPTGTQARNQATIVFDVNAPISTATWLNTLDNTKPTSHVLQLASIQCSPTFLVRWSGTDVGSGIQDFTIFVSDNGAPFIPFLKNTRSTAATFNGQNGHTYSFFSVARDLVGNVEDTKTSGEATTQAIVDTTPPTTTANTSPGPNVNGWNNTNVSVTLNAADNPGGCGVKEIHFSISGAQNGGSVVTGDNALVTVTAEGITTISYFATDNAGNQETPKILTVRIDKTPPVLAGLPAPGCTLWPPNHKLQEVGTVTARDALSGVAAFSVSGTSNEPSNTGESDIVITGTFLQPRIIQLRSERLGTGTGRVYTLTAIATDLAGNAATSSAVCVVPHDRGH